LKDKIKTYDTISVRKLFSNGATVEELKAAGLEGNFAQHDSELFPTDANGVPWSAAYIDTTGDHIADLESDMAAEQRARATYEHLMDIQMILMY